MLVAKPKIIEITESLNRMVNYGVNEVSLGRVKSEIKSLRKAGMILDADLCEGNLAAINFDLALMEKCFSRALAHPNYIDCYFVSLINAKQLVKAEKFCRENSLLDRFSDDLHIINKVFNLYCQSLNYEGIRAVATQLKKLKQWNSDYENRFKMAKNASNLFKRFGCTWQEFSERLFLLYQFVSKTITVPLNIQIEVNEISQNIVVTFNFKDLPMESLQEIESGINNLLASEAFQPIDEITVFFAENSKE